MHLIYEYGLVAVAAIIGLECLGLPVPGGTALLGAAIYAGTKHDFNINAVIAAAAIAAITGRMIGYVIGHKLGSWLLSRRECRRSVWCSSLPWPASGEGSPPAAAITVT